MSTVGAPYGCWPSSARLSGSGSLDRVKEALDQLPRKGLPTKKDWARISRQWHDELTERIEYLTGLRDRFSDCIGCGCLSLKSCPYSNPDDALGAGGQGPRRFP